MAERLNPHLVELYGIDEFYAREPVPGLNGLFVRAGPTYFAFANVLGEALSKLELARNVKITPYNGSWEAVKFAPGEQAKYFIYEKSDGSRTLVDIHILRRGEELCPKQDLTFALCDGDIIVPGALIC